MHASLELVAFDLLAAGVAQDQPVGRQRHRLADCLRGETFGKGRGHGFGGAFAAGAVNRLAQALDPAVVGLPLSGGPPHQPILIEKLGKDNTDLRRSPVVFDAILFRVHAIAHGLTQQRPRLFLTG